MALVTTRQKQGLIGRFLLVLLVVVLALLPYTIVRSVMLNHGGSEGGANAAGWAAMVLFYGAAGFGLWRLIRRLRPKTQRPPGRPLF